MMPKNYILIRHGESEGNVAVNASKNGDESYFTDKYVMTPGHQWRLTNKGVLQANAIGEWLNENLPKIDRYYVSPYVRTRMTAAQLNLTDANWRVNRAYREREWGEVEALPRSIFQEQYPNSARVKKLNPLYWCPPGGESIAEVAENRVRNILDTLHRECEDKTVLAVTHGENMWAHRLILERWMDEEFFENDADESQRIENCQVLWYRQGTPGDRHINELKVITPVEINGKWEAVVTKDWTKFDFPLFTNETLWDSVKNTPHIFEPEVYNV